MTVKVRVSSPFLSKVNEKAEENFDYTVDVLLPRIAMGLGFLGLVAAVAGIYVYSYFR